jgi:hypothetical protein
MEYLLPLISGISAKVYDDISDTNISVSDIIKESLKGVQWTTLALLSVNDFNFTSIFYISILSNYFGDPTAYSTPYEQALLLIFPCLLFFNFHTIQSMNLINLIVIIPFIIVMYSEQLFITENVSYKKLLSRLVMLFNLIIVCIFSTYLHLSPSILKIVIYGIGYLLISCIFQIYNLTE